MTFVYGMSTIDECGLPLKSIETSSSYEQARMPFNGPSAAAWSAPLTSSAVTFLLRTAARSTHDTFGVGTRIEMPSSFPLSSGSTSPTAPAAPVLAANKDNASARGLTATIGGVLG